jgi:ribonuclease HI
MADSGSWKKITIHTDGGCEGNPGPGGCGALLRYGNYVRMLTGGQPATTNNHTELRAAISALQNLKEPCDVTLFTDSEYLRRGTTEWLPRRRDGPSIDAAERPDQNCSA